MRNPKRLIPFMAEGDILSQDESRSLIERVVAMSSADSIAVNVTSNVTNNVRFAANNVSTAGSVADMNVAVTSSYGPKKATVVTNNTSEEALRATVKQSETLAKLAPDDPEAMPNLGPQNIRNVNAAFPETEGLDANALARAAMTALEPARRAGDLTAAGYLVVSTGTNALGNREKLFAYHKNTNANYTVTVRTTDGTGTGSPGQEHQHSKQLHIACVS